MKLSIARAQLDRIAAEHPDSDPDLMVTVCKPGFDKFTPVLSVVQIDNGTGRDKGRVLLSPSKPLTALSAEELQAVQESVRNGESWHAQQQITSLREQVEQLEAQVLRYHQVVREPLKLLIKTVRMIECFRPDPTNVEGLKKQALELRREVADLRKQVKNGTTSPQDDIDDAPSDEAELVNLVNEEEKNLHSPGRLARDENYAQPLAPGLTATQTILEILRRIAVYAPRHGEVMADVIRRRMGVDGAPARSTQQIAFDLDMPEGKVHAIERRAMYLATTIWRKFGASALDELAYSFELPNHSRSANDRLRIDHLCRGASIPFIVYFLRFGNRHYKEKEIAATRPDAEEIPPDTMSIAVTVKRRRWTAMAPSSHVGN